MDWSEVVKCWLCLDGLEGKKSPLRLLCASTNQSSCSGCSTLLKTISGEDDGFFVDEKSEINYQGIPKEIMHKDFRGECIYQAEVRHIRTMEPHASTFLMNLFLRQTVQKFRLADLGCFPF